MTEIFQFLRVDLLLPVLVPWFFYLNSCNSPIQFCVFLICSRQIYKTLKNFSLSSSHVYILCDRNCSPTPCACSGYKRHITTSALRIRFTMGTDGGFSVDSNNRRIGLGAAVAAAASTTTERSSPPPPPPSPPPSSVSTSRTTIQRASGRTTQRFGRRRRRVRVCGSGQTRLSVPSSAAWACLVQA